MEQDSDLEVRAQEKGPDVPQVASGQRGHNRAEGLRIKGHGTSLAALLRMLSQARMRNG